MTPLTTHRLMLRAPRLTDAAALYAFLGDREAMRYTLSDSSLRACRRRIAAFERRRRRDGCAPWAVIRRSDGRMIGWGGLYIDPFDPGWGMELGYFLHPEAWGHGYASELAAAALRVADEALRLPVVKAFVHPQNTASRRVLIKAGFVPERYIADMKRELLLRRLPTSSGPGPEGEGQDGTHRQPDRGSTARV